MNREGSTAGSLAFLAFGPIVWALHLTVSYAGHASMCAVGPAEGSGALQLLLGLATFIALAILVVALLRPGLIRRLLRAMPETSPEAGFATTVMRFLGVLSLLGVSFAGMAMLILPLCQQLR